VGLNRPRWHGCSTSHSRSARLPCGVPSMAGVGMKAVLRFGALVVGLALATSGVGEAAPSKKAAKKPPAAAKAATAAKPAMPGALVEKEKRQGPARVSPANSKFAELPRIADEKKDALADRKRDEAIEGFKRLIPKIQD